MNKRDRKSSDISVEFLAETILCYVMLNISESYCGLWRTTSSWLNCLVQFQFKVFIYFIPKVLSVSFFFGEGKTILALTEKNEVETVVYLLKIWTCSE